jgi:ABC-type branched-subunit amino acid transport system ATPase component/ABC-type branched-subunit amino acid transport system permease subunit
MRVRLGTFAVVLGFLVCLPWVPGLGGVHQAIWSNALIDIILFLSLGLLVRVSGQISLCHLAFAAVGAAAFGHFADSYRIPWLLALLLAVLVTIPVGALVAIPAIRLSGVFLALATFGFGILLQQVFYTTGFMFGPTTAGVFSPRPSVNIGSWNFSTDNGFYWLLLIFAVLTVVVILGIQRGRMGRLLAALSDSPTALETLGATTNVIRVLIFCITAALASLAGALFAMLFHYGVGSDYDSFQSLLLVALVVIAVAGDPWYAVIAAVGYTVFPGYVTVGNISVYLQIAFGVFAATYAAQASRIPTVPKPIRDFLDRIGGRSEQPTSAASAAAPPAATAMLRTRAAGDGRRADLPSAGLEVRDLSVHFGGVAAVSSVSFEAPMARITGLVGPNGAGKTTTFNACSGLTKPTSGRVILHGRDVTAVSPAGRSRLGLGRTFQRAELFNSLTVRENVELGREAYLAGANPVSQLVSRRADRAAVRRAVEEAMELTGVAPLADLQAGLLPTGRRRMVELTRVLAGPFDLLLLDEPSAGLDPSETEQFGDILTTVVAERGIGILLVEHDMSLVRQVCAHIFVLDFGELIFEGTPAEMLASHVVRDAYLGSEGVEQEAEAFREQAQERRADEAANPV